MTLTAETYQTSAMSWGYRLRDARGHVVAQKAGYATQDNARTAGWSDMTELERGRQAEGVRT